MATTCKDIEKWRLRRETRKMKSSNARVRNAAKRTLKALKNKKIKAFFMKTCKEHKEYEKTKYEKEYNEQMDT